MAFHPQHAPVAMHPAEFLPAPHPSVEQRERLSGGPLLVVRMDDGEPEVRRRGPLDRRIAEHRLDVVGDEVDPLRGGVGAAPGLPDHTWYIRDDVFEGPAYRRERGARFLEPLRRPAALTLVMRSGVPT